MCKVLIIDLNELKDSIFKNEFIEPICNILDENGFKYEVKHFLEDYKSKNYERIILSGVPLKDFSYEDYISEFEWIKKISKPILGICSGGQVIVKIFGGEIIKSKEIGIIELEKTQDDKILKNFKNEIKVYFLHNKSFITPLDFNIILKNKLPQLIKHPNKKIYACAFHPEVKNKEIIENFLYL